MCSRCRSHHVDPSGKSIPVGYGTCTHRPVWEFRASHRDCYFTPSRYQEAA